MKRFTLNDLGLFDRGPDAVFDNIVDLVHQTVLAPIALVSVIDDKNERQVFKASRGLCREHPEVCSTPLSLSLCNEVRLRSGPLVIPDLSRDPEFRDHPARHEMGVSAYLGAPLKGPADDMIGAVCAIDTTPRIWSERDRKCIEKLADLGSQQVLLRAALQTLKLIA
ncbi:GAF domain-containing protein [Salipiger mucosus]|uniref:GAF domain-containing protein n=1 Tax=Salipiger mucosus TaxID=263378 RepID=UPI0012EB22B1|nr:GAF domain-containing protein [Salipiger mucosus]